jgi:hypothetical protein
MGYELNGVEDGGCPFHIVKKIIEGFDVPYFVETGTAGGVTIKKASEIFKECHTIEIIPNRTLERNEINVYDENDPTLITDIIFVPIEYSENITFHLGDTTKVLPKILSKVNDNYCVFWLDAHYSDEIPSEDGTVECPILDELQIISLFNCHNKAIILIDDARLFFGTPPSPMKPELWASLQDIFDSIRKNFPYHHFTIVDDYIVAVPNEMKQNLFNEWLERFKIRYP